MHKSLTLIILCLSSFCTKTTGPIWKKFGIQKDQNLKTICLLKNSQNKDKIMSLSSADVIDILEPQIKEEKEVKNITWYLQLTIQKCELIV